SIGNPNVSGASVKAEVVESGKDKKIVVFKYKAKTRYRRKNGHRQQYTDLRVTEISLS
ncbi:MAG: 50S ribosomal protein L21, partial [Chloroflexi bacterium]|nr:50S ribosomal protein L21 [Chloroflexota bacterium]